MESLDATCPGSKTAGLEYDKVSCVLLIGFFPANRPSIANQGQAEFGKVMSNTKIHKVSLENNENRKLYIKFQNELDEILAKHS